jgi:ketosteroid isomerase-like protein
MSKNGDRVRAFYEGAASGAPDDLVDGGDRVVALGRFCGTPRASGRYVEVPFALVWTMRDGQAVEVDEHTDTALLLEALRRSGAGGV